MNPGTLDAFGVFLHRKKGEIARAESFFRRLLHIVYKFLTMSIFFQIIYNFDSSRIHKGCASLCSSIDRGA